MTSCRTQIDAETRCGGARPALDAWLTLSKARLSSLVLVTAAIGFFLGTRGEFDWLTFAAVLLGTALSAFGVNAINQCMEIERDARMERTRTRPLPAGTITLRAGWTFGVALAVAGPLLLVVLVNPLTALLGLICELVYVFIYTPMKTRTSLNTLVGAVCGALPPMMGWTAAAGRLEPGAWVLGAILFVWQIPHFLALAWMYRDDYQRGGFQMLPAFDRGGQATCEAVVLYSLALAPVTLMLTVVGSVGWLYAVGALVLTIGLTSLGVSLYRRRSLANARRVFVASVIYLPLLTALMVADRTGRPLAATTIQGGAGVSPVAAPHASSTQPEHLWKERAQGTHRRDACATLRSTAIVSTTWSEDH